MSKEKRKRTKNTSREQYMLYLNYMENDYAFRSNTVNPTLDENYLNNKWIELTSKLNALGDGPKLDVGEWKKRFAEWKYATRSKYRKISEERKKTGGGPASEIKLSDIEDRGLAIWGQAVVQGALHVTDYEGITETETNEPVEEFYGNEINTRPFPETQEIVINNDSQPKAATSNIQEIIEDEPMFSLATRSLQQDRQRTPVTSRACYNNKNIKKKSNIRSVPLGDMANKLITETETVSKTNILLQENLQELNKNYKHLEEENIKHRKKYFDDKIKVEQEKLRFEIAKYKFENKDFVFE